MRQELRRHQSANKQLEEKGFPALVLDVERHVRQPGGSIQNYSVEILPCHVAQTQRPSAQLQY
jgi:hypothetical protein